MEHQAVSKHDVVIAGGGPTGLMLAAELALARVDVAIVERREDQELVGQRAGGLHARTLEVLDQRGVVARFLAEGQPMQVAGFARNRLDLSDLPTRHPYVLALRQKHIERLLAAWVAELGVPVYRRREVTGLAQDDAGVDVALDGGTSLRARYLVGCDGGRSVVRKQAGIEFPGWDASVSYLIAEAEVAEEPPLGVRRGERGVHAIGKLEDGSGVGIVLTEARVGAGEAPTLEDLRAALVGFYGTDYGLRGARWLSRFTDMARQAATYRKGRVLLAGDAAHVHSPVGGQGLNTGVQDAVNLGWKLGLVVHGAAPDTLLDSYHAERHPVAARVLRNDRAQTALDRGDDRTEALREVITDLLAPVETRRRYAAMMAGLDIAYDLGGGHPLVGRRMPDLELTTADGPRRVYPILHDARPLLLELTTGTAGAALAAALAPWAGRVRHVVARPADEGAWELPVVGAVDAPAAVLVRPDGHVAWVGGASHTGPADAGLREALTAWCGSGQR